MKKSKRYETSHLIEDQHEPGSRGRVLKNHLGITSKREMDRREKVALIRTMEELANIFDMDHRFTAADLCKIHKLWLSNIYEWAGKYRQVMMSKNGFPFAFPAQTTLMTLQAGLPPPDFRNMVGREKKGYIKAVQAGIARNYKPMEKIFAAVIRKTLRVRARK